MTTNRIFLLLLLPLLLLTSCQPARQEGTDKEGDTVALHYARNLQMVEHEHYTLATLRNPWDTTQVLHRYALVDRNEAHLPTLADATTIVRVPLQRAAVFCAVHSALLCELGVLDAIGGVTDSEYLTLSAVQHRLHDGSIADLGSSMAPNLERVMELSPDALMPSPFQNSGGYGRLERLGIPIIECADYMEVSPLARAEWIKFYGRLFGVGERADSLYAEVESQYHELKSATEHVGKRPRLMAEKLVGGTWYTPGGQSTMGILYTDAGAHYLWADSPASGSLSLSLEHIMERALDADVWLIKYHSDHELSYDELANEHSAYKQFRPFREQHIYGCNTGKVRFFEETPFHPERLLRNLINILHPELHVSDSHPYFHAL
ncbi:MAG: ABC transporter substrate-binding protein [Bacteroidales bacterium]|nr:ABC transporter substrate-binding protein [Candidatus Physcousia equi]